MIDQTWILDKIFLIVFVLIMLKLTERAMERFVVRAVQWTIQYLQTDQGKKKPTIKDAAGLVAWNLAPRFATWLGDKMFGGGNNPKT